MHLHELPLKGAFIIENFFHKDSRGKFIKLFNDELFKCNGIEFFPKEIYYSVSKKDVIRGMHFQKLPFEHAKLIYIVSGAIIDVILDIRNNSQTFGKFYEIKIESDKNALYIPIGFAHGFKSLMDNTIVVYNQTSCYDRNSDDGIRWDSFNYDWNIKTPIISERDINFEPFSLDKEYF